MLNLARFSIPQKNRQSIDQSTDSSKAERSNRRVISQSINRRWWRKLLPRCHHEQNTGEWGQWWTAKIPYTRKSSNKLQRPEQISRGHECWLSIREFEFVIQQTAKQVVQSCGHSTVQGLTDNQSNQEFRLKITTFPPSINLLFAPLTIQLRRKKLEQYRVFHRWISYITRETSDQTHNWLCNSRRQEKHNRNTHTTKKQRTALTRRE